MAAAAGDERASSHAMAIMAAQTTTIMSLADGRRLEVVFSYQLHTFTDTPVTSRRRRVAGLLEEPVAC